jgi:hypothetical protein
MSLRTWILTGLALGLLAGSLRFYRLGTWPFFGDELATFSEVAAFNSPDQGDDTSQNARLARMIPLSYLVHNAGYALFGQDEFGSRAMMALLGTVQVVLVFFCLTRPLGWPAALATALLLAVWPEHIYQSQQHRFYMTAAVFSSLCMLAGAWAVQRQSVLLTALACLAAFAAILAHTLQGLTLGGLFIGILVAARVRRQSAPWVQLGVVAAAAMMALTFLAFYLLRQGQGWNAGEGWGSTSGHSLLASLYEIGWPVVLLAGLGAVSIAKQRDTQGWYWLTWAAVWALASVVLPRIVVYHSAYVFPLTLGVLVLAGYASGQIFTYLRRQNALSAFAWLAVVGALNLPSLVSHYSDGSRHDYRTAAHYIAHQWQPGDTVAAVAPGVLRRYESVCREAISLRTWDPLPELERLSGTATGRLWIVLPSYRPGKPETLRRWLATHCTQELEIKPLRYDYREHIVEVFLFTPPGGGLASTRRP